MTNTTQMQQASLLMKDTASLLKALLEDADTTELLASMSATMTALTATDDVQEAAPEVVEQPTEVVEVAEAFEVTPVVKPVKLPADHKFIVVREGDFVDTLTSKGRKVLNHRGTFATLDEATEFARFATERPLYIGEVSLEESAPNEVYTRLKLSYAADF